MQRSTADVNHEVVWVVEKYSRIILHGAYRTFAQVLYNYVAYQVCFSKGSAFVSLGLSRGRTGGKGE